MTAPSYACQQQQKIVTPAPYKGHAASKLCTIRGLFGTQKNELQHLGFNSMSKLSMTLQIIRSRADATKVLVNDFIIPTFRLTRLG